MKAFEQWDLADLLEHINDKIQEGLTLDYKSSKALARTDNFKNELSKDVSSFANSAGGRIIFGIDEAGHLPVAIDGGVDPSDFTREWLEQVINSNVQPRISGVLIKQIAVGPDRVAYALDIPQATALAPHQARDHRYYKRFNFQSVAMEDYEVRDTMRRSTTPAPFIKCTVDIPKLSGDDITVNVRVQIGNKSNEPALYTVIEFYIDDRIWVGVDFDKFSITDATINVEGVQYGCKRLVRNLGIPAFLPLFKEQIFDIGKISLNIGPVPGYIGYKLASPGFSNERFGSIYFDGNAAVLKGLAE